MCTLCSIFFKFRWQVPRHLQDVHAGIQWQCQICGKIYARRTIPHGCRALEKDFETTHTESWAKGAEAKKYLETFVNERMHKHWIYVPEDKGGDKTPQYQRKSTVTKIERGQEPNVNDKKIKTSKQRLETALPVQSGMNARLRFQKDQPSLRLRRYWRPMRIMYHLWSR